MLTLWSTWEKRERWKAGDLEAEGGKVKEEVCHGEQVGSREAREAGPGQHKDSAAPPVAEASQMVRCKFCCSFRADWPWSNH